MLNVYISNIILNKKDKTKTIQLKSINKDKVKKIHVVTVVNSCHGFVCVI